MRSIQMHSALRASEGPLGRPAGDPDGPPSPLVGDVFKTIVLCVLFVVGAPLNLIAAALLRKAPPDNVHWQVLEAQALKRHLNYSDLLIVFFFTTSEVGWLLTYRWVGGLFLCKAVAFGRLLTFQISSNIMVAIAVLRLLSIVCPPGAFWAAKRGTLAVGLAWLTAVLTSAPQLAVWTLHRPFPEDAAWAQCAPVFEMASPANATAESLSLAQAYGFYHVVVVFWLPFAAVLLCYALLLCRIRHFSQSTGRRLRAEQSAVSNAHTLTRAETGEKIAEAAPEAEALMERSTTGTEETSEVLRSIKSARRKTLRVMLKLTVAYLLCWTPVLGLETWKLLDFSSFLTYAQDLPQIGTAAIVLNAVVNPYLYGMFDALRQVI